MWHQRPELGYEESRPWLHRRRTRWIIITVLLLPLLPLTIKIGAIEWQRMQANALFSACLNFNAPPLAYTENLSAQAMLAGRSDYSSAPLGAKPVFLQPTPWMNASGLIGTRIISLGTAFLHGRRTPSGIECLVAVDLVSVQRDVVSTRVEFATRSLVGGSATRSPRLLNDGVNPLLLTAGNGPLTIQSGHADPRDASHFTIPWTIGKDKGVIDGWLKDDGGVLLEARNDTAPTTTSPAQSLPASSR